MSLMAVELTDAYTFIGFAGTVTMAVAVAVGAGYKTARWLLNQFTHLIDSRFDPLETKLDEAMIAVKSVEAVQNQHAERIAWLEGQAGQPLGSITREKT